MWWDIWLKLKKKNKPGLRLGVENPSSNNFSFWLASLSHSASLPSTCIPQIEPRWCTDARAFLVLSCSTSFHARSWHRRHATACRGLHACDPVLPLHLARIFTKFLGDASIIGSKVELKIEKFWRLRLPFRNPKTSLQAENIFIQHASKESASL